MFCPQCGKSYPEAVNFCSHCGTAILARGAASSARKRLTRSRRDSKIAGVCGGFAEYLDVDATLIRLIWVMLALFGGWGVLGYLIGWIIMPEEPAAEPKPATAPAIAPQPAGQH